MAPQLLSRAAAAAAGVLAAIHGYQAWLQAETAGYLAVLSGFAAVLGLLAAIRLGCSGCVESRLLTGAVALGSLGLHLLGATVGLPGQGHPLPPTAVEILTLTLSCLTLLLLTLSSPRARLGPGRRRLRPGSRA